MTKKRTEDSAKPEHPRPVSRRILRHRFHLRDPRRLFRVLRSACANLPRNRSSSKVPWPPLGGSPTLRIVAGSSSRRRSPSRVTSSPHLVYHRTVRPEGSTCAIRTTRLPPLRRRCWQHPRRASPVLAKPESRSQVAATSPGCTSISTAGAAPRPILPPRRAGLRAAAGARRRSTTGGGRIAECRSNRRRVQTGA